MQQGDLISLPSFFQNKLSGIKIFIYIRLNYRRLDRRLDYVTLL
jgi:hypothetical protein